MLQKIFMVIFNLITNYNLLYIVVFFFLIEHINNIIDFNIFVATSAHEWDGEFILNRVLSLFLCQQPKSNFYSSQSICSIWHISKEFWFL